MRDCHGFMVSPMKNLHDVTIVGAGIVGLWCALEAARHGARVSILHAPDAAPPASAGLIGALMPHQPTDWSDKKDLQLRGLLSLPVRLAELSAKTGLPTSWRRTGRLMPVRDEAEQLRHLRWSDGAKSLWHAGGAQWLASSPDIDADWFDASGHHGAALETLTARASPRAILALLLDSLRLPGIMPESAEVADVEDDGTVVLTDGSMRPSGHTIIAAGYRSFSTTPRPLTPVSGIGVKGQAARFIPATPSNPDWPVLFHQGTYVIAHDDGSVVVGSTSENTWDDPASVDSRLETLIKEAKALCPILRDADCVERWAGVRPKASTREPVVGALEPGNRKIVATGGFKISFAIAHLMAEAAIGDCLGQPADFWPAAFRPKA